MGVLKTVVFEERNVCREFYHNSISVRFPDSRSSGSCPAISTLLSSEPKQNGGTPTRNRTDRGGSTGANRWKLLRTSRRTDRSIDANNTWCSDDSSGYRRTSGRRLLPNDGCASRSAKRWPTSVDRPASITQQLLCRPRHHWATNSLRSWPANT